MTALAFALRYAGRSLWRSGQRGVLAVVCVAFGVFSLVSLQLFSGSVQDALLLPPRVQMGGDLALTRDGGLSDADLAALRADPDVGAVETVGRVEVQFVQTVGNGRAHLVNRVLAVDPATFPIVGRVRLESGTLAEALRPPRSAVVTADLARKTGVVVGDRLRLAGSPGERPAVLTVAGVAESTPDAQGGTVLVSGATARAISDAEPPSGARVLTDAPDRVAARFEAAGWEVARPTPSDTDAERLLRLALPAAGLLGLLLGGIGVANTLQVMLARRRTEVATLKALGYRQRDLLALFGAETAILGLAGGVLGVAGGVAGAEALRRITMTSMPFLLSPRVEPSVLVGGLVAGVLTAVLFGMIAIVRTSAVRPATLLRQTAVRPTGRSRAATAGLYAALFVLFGLLGGALLGSAAAGFAVLAGGLVALAVFGGLMLLVLMAVVRVPTPGLPLVRMAASNLRRQPLRAAASLVALFAGTFAIGLSAQAILNGQAEVAGRTVETGGANLVAWGLDADDPGVRRIAADAGAAVWTDRTAPTTVRRGDGAPVQSLDEVTGRGPESASSLVLTDAAEDGQPTAWPQRPDAALVPTWAARWADTPVARGDTLLVGKVPVVVAGFYEYPKGLPLIQTSGLVVAPEAFGRIVGAGKATETVAFEVPPGRLAAVAAALAAAYPDAAVVTGRDLADMVTGVVRGLFALVLALTSLALIAGTVLIANGVGLAMIERRRELGVLKAVGYSAGQVLWTVVLENAILGAVAGGAGVGAVALTLLALGRSAEVPVTIYPGVGLALVAVAVALAAGSALAVAWRPVHARPLDVLRAE